MRPRNVKAVVIGATVWSNVHPCSLQGSLLLEHQTSPRYSEGTTIKIILYAVFDTDTKALRQLKTRDVLNNLHKNYVNIQN